MGPTRCGKTTALAVPAILEWDGPVIALSVKSDLMGATIDARRRRGDVKVFDPGDATSEATSSWSPLRAAGTLNGAKKAARALANATDWTAGSGDMAFWVAGAEDLLAPLLFVAACSNLSMSYVVSWVLKMDRPDEEEKGSTVATLVGSLCNNTVPAVAADAAAASELAVGHLGFGLPAVVVGVCHRQGDDHRLAGPTRGPSARDPSIDLDWLLGEPERDDDGESDDAGDDDDAMTPTPTTTPAVGDGRVGTTRCTCAPRCTRRSAWPRCWAACWATCSTSATSGSANPIEQVGPILVVVDEAGNWPLRNLAALASTCAGIGIQLLLVYQSKAQIDAVYGRQADTIISNCLTKVFFAGLSDRSTLDYAESLLGSEQVLDRHSSIDVGAGSGRRSISQSTTRAELLPMALLRQVRPGEALLVHNTLPPAHLIGRYWFKDPSLHMAATGEPLRRWKPPLPGRQEADSDEFRPGAAGAAPAAPAITAPPARARPSQRNHRSARPLGEALSHERPAPTTRRSLPGGGDGGDPDRRLDVGLGSQPGQLHRRPHQRVRPRRRRPRRPRLGHRQGGVPVAGRPRGGVGFRAAVCAARPRWRSSATPIPPVPLLGAWSSGWAHSPPAPEMSAPSPSGPAPPWHPEPHSFRGDSRSNRTVTATPPSPPSETAACWRSSVHDTSRPAGRRWCPTGCGTDGRVLFSGDDVRAPAGVDVSCDDSVRALLAVRRRCRPGASAQAAQRQPAGVPGGPRRRAPRRRRRPRRPLPPRHPGGGRRGRPTTPGIGGVPRLVPRRPRLGLRLVTRTWRR